MFKNAALGLAVAGLLATSALVAGATDVQAGKKFYFSVNPQAIELGKGGYADQANNCRRWKRKWRRTGRQHYLRKYRNCLMDGS